jgi:outer membrane protein assembly factor BamB
MIQALTLLDFGLLMATDEATDEATDWPQFLGPNRDGNISMSDIRFEWTGDGPPVAWTLPTGVDYGGVAIRAGEVFLLARESSEGDVLKIIDLETGAKKWSVRYEVPDRLSFPGSRTVPAVTVE